MSDSKKPFERLRSIVAELRHPEHGCPWDLEQTHQSLRPYLIEEAYEVLEALEQNDDTAFCEELGDLLLQVMLHAQVADERGAFNVDDVCRGIADKMVRRHPHVFGSERVATSAEVLRNWEEIKLAEKSSSTEQASLLSGVPRGMPQLTRATRLGQKASKAKFDWNSVGGVWGKVEEELGELKRAHASGDAAEIESELGDLLFALCQFARWLKISPEDALQHSSDRFTQRFQIVERELGAQLGSADEDELDRAWERAKQQLRTPKPEA